MRWLQVFEFVSADKAVSWQLFVTKILPVGFFMAGTLSTGNLVYLYLTVSLIQMLKVRHTDQAGIAGGV